MLKDVNLCKGKNTPPSHSIKILFLGCGLVDPGNTLLAWFTLWNRDAKIPDD
jgi:hypothetical protein